jgi:hypothetical protein
VDLPRNKDELRNAVEDTRQLLKRLRIRLTLARIKEAGLRGPGRPRLNLPVTRERVLELHRQGLSSRKISKYLTAEASVTGTGVYVSRDFVYAIIRSEASCGPK